MKCKKKTQKVSLGDAQYMDKRPISFTLQQKRQRGPPPSSQVMEELNPALCPPLVVSYLQSPCSLPPAKLQVLADSQKPIRTAGELLRGRVRREAAGRRNGHHRLNSEAGPPPREQSPPGGDLRGEVELAWGGTAVGWSLRGEEQLLGPRHSAAEVCVARRETTHFCLSSSPEGKMGRVSGCSVGGGFWYPNHYLGPIFEYTSPSWRQSKIWNGK